MTAQFSETLALGDGQDPALLPQPLYELLDESAERFTDHPCTDFLGRTLSYGEISDLVNRAAEGFQKLGVVKGTRVGLSLPNTPFYIISYFAVLKAGGTVVNFNPLYTEREMAHQVTDSSTEIMVTLDLHQLFSKADALLHSTGLRKVVVCRMRDALPTVKGLLFSLLKYSEIANIPEDSTHVRFADLVANEGHVLPPLINPTKDIAVLQYTGGTTGMPKGAMLTHANLWANAHQVRAWFPHMEDGGERMLAVLPFFHVFAMTVVMNLSIKAGAEMVLLPRFELKDTLEAINDKRPTLFPGVPTIYTAINNSPDLDSFDLSSINYCISGGAPLPVEVKRRFEELTGCELVEGYGLTEASPVCLCNPMTGANKEASIGTPLPQTEIEIRDLETGDPCVDGEKGELCIQGPQVMAGYLNRPEETASTIIDGWLHTGDVGYRDADGYVFLVDRIKDLILCSGYNVYPRVIEEAIHEHPAVEEVTVIGIPDDYRGESPKAFIKLRQDMELDEAKIQAFLEERLSVIERPHAIEFRDELPKTMIGKLSKKELKAEQGVGA